jgi:hypothetical protein
MPVLPQGAKCIKFHIKGKVITVNAVEAFEGVEDYVHSCLTFALDGG